MINPDILIIANWKMHGEMDDALALVQQVQKHQPPQNTRIVICPPFTLLHPLNAFLTRSDIELGAQDCHFEAAGAYTGDISASMLKDAGCQWVIVGHSERRHYHQETNQIVCRKGTAAHDSHLVTVICVGETLEEYKQGRTHEVLKAQLQESVPATATTNNIVIAYEPVWSIGTGNVPQLEEIKVAHETIRQVMRSLVKGGEAVAIVYGGSVKPENAEDIFSVAGVNGVLVGGSSLQAEAFCCIISAARSAVPHN